MTYRSQEPLPQPRERAFPLPEDQPAFEYRFTAEYREQFPHVIPLLEGAMATLHRAVGIADSPLAEATEFVGQMATDEEQKDVNELLSRSHSLERATALELTMSTELDLEASPQERFKAEVEQNFFVLEADMPPESRALLEGLYGLIGAHVMRNDHGTNQQAGSVLLRGTYLGRTVYLVEQFQQIGPSTLYPGVEAQEAVKIWSVGEAEALRVLYS